MKEVNKGEKKMARKINSPFNNVPIQTIDSIGSMATFNDAFYKQLVDEMAVYETEDELSSIHLSNYINKIYHKENSSEPTKSTRNSTKNIKQKINLTEPNQYLPYT